ncbi:MAG: GMC family oxidoreductase [Pseudonocardiaceae bacterium]|nr:MAG: GMC family oxidoreductase [Pseudonocardiaceae bacterium]
MTRAHPETDVVIVGCGWVGGILAAELTKAGADVVVLERGPWRSREDVAGSRDEMLPRRLTHTQDTAADTWTLRHDRREAALPIRQAGAWTPGTGVGGSSMLYGGVLQRLQPHDLVARTALTERYGAAAIPADSTLADWGITYDDLAPDYDRFELMAGVSGKAGANPFEGPRMGEYPMPPLPPTPGPTLFADAARRLGLHPFPVPNGTLPLPYTNPDGVSRPACTRCGYCIGTPCETGAKADALATVLPVAFRSGRMDLRCDSTVFRVTHRDGRADGVLYRDAEGEVHHQRGRVVVLAGYTFTNVRLLLLSRLGTPYDPATGTGTVGANYSYNLLTTGAAFFADRRMASHIGAGGAAEYVADFNADNVDHTGLGFVGGGLLWSAAHVTGPIGGAILPPGTPRWGSEFTRALRKWHDRVVLGVGHGEVLPYRDHTIDLDPVYRDAFGDPLARITFDWKPNERALHAFLRARLSEILHEMGPTIVGEPSDLEPHFDTTRYQSTHNTGGAIMGADPAMSTVDTTMRMWEAENVWVVGGSAFPQSAGTGPTATICALAYRASDAIRAHLGSPRPERTAQSRN